MTGLIQWFGKLYRKYFSRSFFRKIFLVYLGITVMTGLILFIVLSRNLTSIKYDQALIMSDQAITTVDSFLQNKIDGAVSIHQRLYREADIWGFLTDRLQGGGKDELYAFQQQEISLAVVNTIYGIDRDFNGLFLGSYEDGSIFQYGSGSIAAEKEYFKGQLSRGNELPKLASARNGKSPGNAFSLFLFGPVKTPDYSRDIGCIGLYFNAMNIKQCYREYEKYLKGCIYVFSREGELLFDSAASYSLPENFPTEKLLVEKTARMTEKRWVYNTLYSRENGYYVVNAFPVEAVREDVRIPQRTMILVFAAALCVAVLLNYISTHFFAKRLQPITDTIEQVKNGHLTSFPIQKKYDDEVGYIYTELLCMCASLDDHIQKEYVYRLRQKEMELYALQAQIDPHFLYNTLEAIRMKLYVKGETEASRMIWILSELFRNMMKKDAVVTNREELKNLNSYLELFAFRLGSRMRYVFEIQEEVYRYATVKHILQPIVENALVHGLSGAGTQEVPCTIRVEGRKEGEDIVFVISDDGSGIPEDKLRELKEKLEDNELFQKSIGICNVSSRLKIVYGPSYRLKLDSAEGKGTTVTVRIKAMKKKELEEYVQTIDR